VTAGVEYENWGGRLVRADAAPITIDEHGMTKVYLLGDGIPDEKRWRRCAPVDAKEMISLGIASLCEPGTPPPVPKLRSELGDIPVMRLREIAASMGLQVDGRWSAARIQKVILAAQAKLDAPKQEEEDAS